MSFQLLPNWCKKLGLIVFFTTAFISMYQGFMKGFTGKPLDSDDFNFFTEILGKKVIHILDVLSMVGMIIYMLSKEKVEDDYINKLRLESYQTTALIGLVCSILLFASSNNIRLTLDYFIILFLWIYLITFAIKKRLY